MCAHHTRRRCPAPGCQEQVLASLAYCRLHWFALPQQLRRDINRSWARFKHVSPTLAPDRHLALRKAHLALLVSAKQYLAAAHPVTTVTPQPETKGVSA